MNNSEAEPTTVHRHSDPVRQRSGTYSAVPGRTDDPIRDFFRRGDRGQYEGGAADRSLDSLPSGDLPERPQIVRTPEQKARRTRLMRLEVLLFAACLVLLATAAHRRFIAGNAPQRAHASEADQQHKELSSTEPPLYHEQPSRPAPTVAATPSAQAPAGVAQFRQKEAASNPNPLQVSTPSAQAPTSLARVQQQEPAGVPEPVQASGGTSQAATASVPAVAEVKLSKQSPTSSQPKRSNAVTQGSLPPPAATPIATTARRAVAAFPED